MANTFKIVITASDKATATVRKIKDSIAQFTRPIRQVKSSIGALGRELGLNKVAAGMAKLSRGAVEVATKVGGVVAAVGAVAGVTSLAAIAAMTREWAFAGAEVLRSAGIIGTTTGKLQTLRGAAVAFGLTAEDLTGGLKALGDTMENAVFGRDQGAMAMMNRLSIHMKKTKDGSVDAVAGLYDVANAIQRTKNVQAQGVIARTFGVEALLPMLQKGAAGIKEYQAAVAKSGAVQSDAAIKGAQVFMYKLALLKLQITGVTNSIMGDLIPAVSPLVDGLGKWAVQNRAVIATNVKDFILGVTAGVKGLAAVVSGAAGIISSTIGWRNAGIALAVLLAGRLLMSIWGLVAPITILIARMTFLGVTAIPRLMLGVAALTEARGLPLLARAFFATGIAAEAMLGPLGLALIALTAVIEAMKWVNEHNPHPVKDHFGGRGTRLPSGSTGNSGNGRVSRLPTNNANARQAMAFFQQQGWTRNQAAGIVGNMAFESGMNPGQREIGGGPGGGLEQWGKRRQADFKKWSHGRDLMSASLSDQLRFAQFELTQGSERAAGQAIRRQSTASGASDAALFGLERPRDPSQSRAARQRLSEAFAAPDPGAAPKGLAKALADAQGGGAGRSPAPGHTVTVKFENAPKGMKADVKSTGAGASKPAVKIDYAMAELSPP